LESFTQVEEHCGLQAASSFTPRTGIVELTRQPSNPGQSGLCLRELTEGEPGLELVAQGEHLLSDVSRLPAELYRMLALIVRRLQPVELALEDGSGCYSASAAPR